MRTLSAALIGLVVGGVSSALIVSLKGPVFHWEMAGMFVVFFATVGGAIAGGLSSAVCSRIQESSAYKGFVGSFLGAGTGFVMGLWVVANSSARAHGAPKGLAIWVVLAVAIAGGLAGYVGGLLSKRSSLK